MDLATLAAALVGEQTQREMADRNPFLPLAGVGDAVGSLLINPAKGSEFAGLSTRDRVIGSLASGLASGLFTNLGNSYTDKQNSAAFDVLSNALTGRDVGDRPSSLTPSLFSRLKNTGTFSALEQSMASAAEEKKYDREFRAKLAEKVLENPYKAKAGLAALGLLDGGRKQAEPIVANEAPDAQYQTLMSDGAASPIVSGGGSIGGSDPGALYEKYLGVFQGDEAMARDAVKRDLEAPDKKRDLNKEVFDQTSSLRKEFIALQPVKDYATIVPLYQNLKAAMDDPSSISDLDFVYATAKILDPTSVVRESEAGMVIDSQSIPASLTGKLNKYITGEGGAVPRAELLRLAKRHLDTQKLVAEDYADKYAAIGGDSGLKREFIAILPNIDGDQKKSAAGSSSELTTKLATEFKVNPDLTAKIAEVAAAEGVPPEIALAVARKESGFNQNAKGTSGEIGIFQIMPGTAKDLGVNPENLSENILGGIRYLKQLNGMTGGDWDKTLTAYNGGIGNLRRGTTSKAARDYAKDVMNVSAALSKGVPFSDEVIAGLDTALEAVPGIGTTPIRELPDYYSQRVNVERQLRDDFAKANPGTDIALNVAGSIPATIVGGRALKVLEKPYLGSALFGALYGAGEGETPEQRALMSAVGAAAGPIGEAGVRAGSALAAPAINAVKRGASDLASRLFGNQAGKIGETAEPIISQGSLYAARQMSDVPPEAIQTAVQTLRDNPEIPLVAADLLQSPRVEKTARSLANSLGSAEQSTPSGAFSPMRIVEDRAVNQPGRLQSQLDTLTPERDPAILGKELVDAVEGAKGTLEQTRRSETEALYKGIGYGDDKTLRAALKDPLIAKEVKSLKANAVLGPELKTMDPRDPEFLIKLRTQIGQKAKNLERNGEPQEAATMNAAFGRLTNAMEEGLPGFREATAKYSELSQPINELTGKKGGRGIAKKLLNIDELKTADAGKALFDLEPSDVASLKARLGDKGEDAMKKGVRAYLSDILRDKQEGKAAAQALLSRPSEQEVARAALGDEEFSKLMKKLDLEKLIQKQNRKYYEGSSTKSNLEVAEDLNRETKGLSAIQRAITYATEPMSAVVDYLSKRGLDQRTAQEAARIFFDRDTGIQFLEKVLPIMKEKIARGESLKEGVSRGITSAAFERPKKR